MPKPNVQRASALLASVTEEFIGGLDQQIQDNTIRVERILLEMVRPDPVQPRRVLPERIHFAFHDNRLTPTQALRELVQIAQVAARQRGHPFSDVVDLVTEPETDDEVEVTDDLSPEEKLLRDLVNLALTIRDDGQVNPLTVVDMTHGVTRLYRIETGERRYWATWLLRDFLHAGSFDGTIPCIVIPTQRASVFRQAKENSARAGLSAIAMARQAALLLLAVHGYEIPSRAVGHDFYRQALVLDLRGKREYTEVILSAMGGIGKARFRQYKALLNLSDEALELADRHQLDEGVLRHVLSLGTGDQAEMIQQIISLGLTRKQVQEICEHPTTTDQPSDSTVLPRSAVLIAKAMRFRSGLSSQDVAQALIAQEGDAYLARAKVQMLKELLLSVDQLLSEV